MPTVSSLTATQLARHAFNVFLFAGRHVTGTRLIYHSLCLDCEEPLALRCLSDLLDAKGTEVFSAATLEYALRKDTRIVGEDWKTLDDLRFLSQWSWGFSKHKSGSPHLDGEAFKDRARFTVEEARYQAFIGDLLLWTGSLGAAFRCAHLLCGTMGGLLSHKEFGAKAPMTELIHADRFVSTDEYRKWLASDTQELDALEVARQEKTKE